MIGVSTELKSASRHIALAMSKLAKLDDSDARGWSGKLGDYKSLGRLLCKTMALADKVESHEQVVEMYRGRSKE